MSGINYETIQQYLNGELTAGEAAAFETAMKNDPALANEVQLYKSIDDEMKVPPQQITKEQELKTSLKDLTGEFFAAPTSKVVSIKKYRWYAAAAAAAVIIAFVWLNRSSADNFDNKKLYAYYMEKKEELTTGSRGSNDDTSLVKGIQLFNNKEYSQALTILQQVVFRKPGEIDIYLAVGYCYMQTGDDEEAMKIFNTVAEGNSVYKDRAGWYKALLLLHQNKIDECYAVLAKLPEGSDHHKQAEELMKKIDKHRKK